MPRPFVPKIATSNHLLTGEAIYYAADGWTPAAGRAEIAHSAEEAETLAKRAARYPHETVGVDLIDVDITDGAPIPRHFRDRVRLLGPSNYDSSEPDHV